MSWGYKVTIITCCFVCFMISMVVAAFRQNFDLVAEDYYGQELKFQSQIDKQRNHEQLQGTMTCEQKEEGIYFSFPDQLQGKRIEGNVLFFRPSDALRDRSMNWKTDEGKVFFSKKDLLPGLYSVRMDYRSGGTSYYYQRDLVIR